MLARALTRRSISSALEIFFARQIAIWDTSFNVTGLNAIVPARVRNGERKPTPDRVNPAARKVVIQLYSVCAFALSGIGRSHFQHGSGSPANSNIRKGASRSSLFSARRYGHAMWTVA